MSIGKDKHLISTIKDSGEPKTDEEIMQELLTPTLKEDIGSLIRDIRIIQTTNFLVLLLCSVTFMGVLADNYFITVIPLTTVGVIMVYLTSFRYKRKKYNIAYLHLICVICVIASVTVRTMKYFEIGVFK